MKRVNEYLRVKSEEAQIAQLRTYVHRLCEAQKEIQAHGKNRENNGEEDESNQDK